MKKIILGVVFFAIPFIMFSQWIKLPTPTINGIADIKFTDSLHGYAAGYEHILQSIDGGNTWQIKLTQPSLIIAELCFPDPNTGYVVGDNGFLLKTTDAGNIWFPSNSPTYDILRGVYFLNPDTGFICGQQEGIYHTEDGGTTWSRQTEGAYWLRQFSFPTPQVGYCVGDGFTVYKTVNGGLSWDWMNGGSAPNLTDVIFLTPDTGFICGYQGLIAKTIDGGLTWQTLEQGVNNNFSGIWFFNTMEGYVVGTDGLIMKTSDGGLTWTGENSGTNSFLRNAFFFSKDEGFICGMNGTILKKGYCTETNADFTFDVHGLSVYFYNRSNCANEYWWDFGDGYYSDLENPWHIYDLSGIYEVCLTANDTVSLTSDSVCQTVEILIVGIDEKRTTFSVYPNPCNDRLFLNNQTGSPIERIEVFSTIGIKVLALPVNKEKAEIRIELPQGLYLLKGYARDQQVLLSRIMVMR